MIDEIKDFLNEKLNNVKVVDKYSIKAECIYCGRSKHNLPHLKITINPESNFYYFYCFRCYQHGSLVKILKDLNAPKQFIDFIKKNSSYSENNKDVVFQSKTSILNYSNSIKEDKFISFISERLLIDKSKINQSFANKFKVYTNSKEEELAFLTYHQKMLNIYKFNSHGYIKYKKVVNSINLPDYYFVRENQYSFDFKNLFITEGVFDLLSLYFHFYIKGDFLAMLGKNIKKIPVFLKSIGHLNYESIFLVLDNDVNEKDLINKFIYYLKDFSKSFYVIKPFSKYIDINEHLIKEKSILKLNIEKLS